MNSRDENINKGWQGESAVNKLTFDTYLKYWCYPNPKDEYGDKKEICDLLIIFKDVLIIVAIKNYSFNGDYEKYFRSTLDKALLQLNGAERKLFTFPRDIFIKHPNKPIEKFEKTQFKIIHRIIINLNNNALFYPGGLKTKKNEFAHVFNWDAFLKLVLELDTIPDFIQYLNVRKDCFINKDFMLMTGSENDYTHSTNQEFLKYTSSFTPLNKQCILVSGTELDLLADYFFNERKFNTHFYSSDYNTASFELDGKWDRYLSKNEVHKKKAEDKASYFIDEFVKNEVLYKLDSNNLEIAVELLSFNRFERRILSRHFFEFYDKYKDTKGLFMARRYGVLNDIVVFYFIHSSNIINEQAMKMMELGAEGFCLWEGYKTKKMIIISTTEKLNGFKYGLFKDITPFSKEHEEDLRHDLSLLNWFQNIENVVYDIKEYPE